MQMLNPEDFVITTPSFRLGVMQKTEIDTYIRLFTDQRLMRRIDLPLTVDAAAADAMLAVEVSGRPGTRQLYLHIRTGDSAEPAGMFSVVVSKLDSSAEVGIMLLRQFHQTGLAELVLKCVCDKLFTTYSLNYVQCRIHRLNYAAQKLAIKVGFLRKSTENIYVLEKAFAL